MVPNEYQVSYLSTLLAESATILAEYSEREQGDNEYFLIEDLVQMPRRGDDVGWDY